MRSLWKKDRMIMNTEINPLSCCLLKSKLMSLTDDTGEMSMFHLITHT